MVTVIVYTEKPVRGWLAKSLNTEATKFRWV